MIEYLIVCVRLLFIISVNGELDITLYIKNYGSVVCSFTNFCHTKATKALSNDTLMSCCLPCSCEANCWKVGNCCPDRNTTDFELPDLKCIDTMVKHRAYDNLPYVSYTDGIQTYRVKDSCLATENNEKVIKLCEEEEKTNVEEYTWVSEISSGRIFKNRYCALCNNVSDFEEWQIRTRFSPALLTNYSHLSKSILSDECDLIAEIPETQRELGNMYRCLILRFSKCNESGLWSHFDQAFVRACDRF